MKTRDEAQASAIDEVEEYRTMSFATMAILEKLKNKTLTLILSPNAPGITADTEDLLVFLFVHWRKHDLKVIRRQLADIETFNDRVYAWAESVDPEIIGKGISYFLGVKEDVKLNGVEAIPEPGKNKESKN